jgi:PAS domain S-box-containing protein
MTVHADKSPRRPAADSPARPARPRRPGHRTAGPKLLASIVESSDDAILSKTLDGVITSWNKAAERIYGYQAAEIIGRSVSLLIPPDRPEEMAEILDQIRAGERVDHYETMRRRKDGATIAVSVTVSPIHDAAGGIIGASSIARVIGEPGRLRAQPRAASSQDSPAPMEASQDPLVEKLRATAWYSRSLIEASLGPLGTISPEGKITDVNEAVIQMTGVAREQMIGSDFWDVYTEPDRAREGYRQVFAEGSVADYPLTVRHTDGRLTEVLLSASVYKDEAGHVLGAFAAVRDVTAQRRAEGEVTKQRARELERLAELERFQKLTVGRELRMIELKKEIEELRAADGGK